MTTKPNRNDPCPCGSGKKYRHCHGDPAQRRGVPLWVYVSVGVVALVGIAFYLTRRQSPASQGTQGMPPTPFSSTPAGPAAGDPAPYAYDSTRRQHWDPAHRHWHDGPPPSSAPNAAPASPPFGNTFTPVAPPAATSAETPEPAPYFYRASTDEFWDPTHKHWHKGKPPVATPSLTDTTRR